MSGWNESFTVGGDAGGWNDTSFATSAGPTKDSSHQRICEKLPVPVTVAHLADNTSGDEKYTIGTYAFNTVLTIGDVVTAEETDQMSYYTLADPASNDSQYKVQIYKGLDGEGAAAFEVGTRLHVVGKLRSFDGNNMITAFSIREADEPGEWTAFVKEAQIAQLFFEKDVAMKIRQENAAQELAGCCAGAPIASEAGTSTQSNYAAPSVNGGPARIYDGGNAGGGATGAVDVNGLTGLSGKIFAYIKQHGATEAGVHQSDIKRAMGGVSDSEFQAKLSFLSNDGHIYSTTDDEHWAPI